MQPKIIPISDASQAPEARRVGLRLAESLEWEATAAGKLGIVITEIGTNLVKHAQGGEIHLQTCTRNGSTGIEVIAFDRGPGIASLERCLRDGYSTAATAGTGLGAIARLADEFDIHSQPKIGTCLVARIFSSATKSSSSKPTSPHDTGHSCSARCGRQPAGRPSVVTVGERGLKKAGRSFCWPTV